MCFRWLYFGNFGLPIEEIELPKTANPEKSGRGRWLIAPLTPPDMRVRLRQFMKAYTVLDTDLSCFSSWVTQVSAAQGFGYHN
jgi:hypothetical protein